MSWTIRHRLMALAAVASVSLALVLGFALHTLGDVKVKGPR